MEKAITYAGKDYYLCRKTLLPMPEKTITLFGKLYYLIWKTLLPMMLKNPCKFWLAYSLKSRR